MVLSVFSFFACATHSLSESAPPRSGGSASAFWRAASALAGRLRMVRPAPAASPRFSSFRRSTFSS
jgi:hypothetical protein